MAQQERTPVLILSYNRYSFLVQQMNVLLRTPDRYDITIIDNGSTQDELLDYYNQLTYNGVARIWRMCENTGHLGPWERKVIPQIVPPDTAWIFTDCDVLPPENVDYLDILYQGLDMFPEYNKCGLGLRINDIPDDYPLKDKAIRQEHSLKRISMPGTDLFVGTWIDTTFALHRPNTCMHTRELNALRTCKPEHLATHLGWYVVPPYDSETINYYSGSEIMSTHYNVLKKTYG